jgi:hypothetical protein
MHPSLCTKVFAAGLSAAAMVACDNSPTGPSQSVTLTSVAALDGWVRSDGDTHTNGGGPILGDHDANTPGLGYRQFHSFELALIPGNATIESATLRLYQANLSPTPPYATHGNVIVDRVDIGVALNAADYGVAALTGNIGTLSNNATKEYKTLDVTTAVRADRTAGRTRSDFRLRMANFDSNNDGLSQFTGFGDFETSCCDAQSPQLVIEYVIDE